MKISIDIDHEAEQHFFELVHRYGLELQTDIMLEELGELIQATVKRRRAYAGDNKVTRDKINADRHQLEEMADVIIMVLQIYTVSGYVDMTALQEEISRKLLRQKERKNENDN